jgi:hypothetical protein
MDCIQTLEGCEALLLRYVRVVCYSCLLWYRSNANSRAQNQPSPREGRGSHSRGRPSEREVESRRLRKGFAGIGSSEIFGRCLRFGELRACSRCQLAMLSEVDSSSETSSSPTGRPILNDVCFCPEGHTRMPNTRRSLSDSNPYLSVGLRASTERFVMRIYGTADIAGS